MKDKHIPEYIGFSTISDRWNQVGVAFFGKKIHKKSGLPETISICLDSLPVDGKVVLRLTEMLQERREETQRKSDEPRHKEREVMGYYD